MNILGGKNYFMASMYFGAGTACWVIAYLFHWSYYQENEVIAPPGHLEDNL